MRQGGSRRRYAAAVMVAVVAAGALAFARWQDRRGRAGPVMQCPVERKSVGIVLKERGFLQSRESVPVYAGTSGDILEIAKSGARVRADDPVLRVDNSELAEEIEDFLVDIETAQTEREMNTAELRKVERQEQNNIELWRKRLELARLRLQTAEAGLAAEDRRLLVIDRDLARLDVEDATDELARQKRLLDKGFISTALLEPFERRVASTAERATELEVRISLEEKGVSAEERLELTREVERLEALIARGARAKARQLERVGCEIRASEAKIAESRFKVARAEAELSNTVARAGIDGILSVRLLRDWRTGGQWAEYRPGIQVERTDAVADVIHAERMAVSLMVHESDWGRTRTGMPCRVRLPAHPDREFRGSLTAVGGIGRDRFDVAPPGFEQGRANVAVFNATVAFDAAGAELRPGMSAHVDIVVEEPASRLVVSRSGIRRHGNGFVARVKRGSGARDVEVRGRIYNQDYFLVDSGLRQGDVVLAVEGSEGG